jgi:ABC-type molybdenum transport system ATPase subunit/photorepair protein PhrA
MVTKIEINNPSKSCFDYIKSKYDRDGLSLPKRIEFKQGKNILVGENGCGKTTILNIIAFHTFCMKNEYSKVTNESLAKWFDFETFKDGINVFTDYDIPTYKSLFEEEKNENEILNSFKNFANTFYSKELSSGENTLRTLRSLFEVMFSGKYTKFDKSFLTQNVNDVWEKRFDSINGYFKRNHIAEENPVFTILLDEPDRNLSINNMLALFDILSVVKDNEQMIAAIHNPVLIYKLSKLEHINFIELTKGYVNSIKELIEG